MNMEQDKKPNYGLFAAMIATCMVVMFGLMYLNTYEFSHVRWSEMRFYMTFIMGAAMAVIMLSFMRGMYSNQKINLAIYLGSLAVFLLALFLVRSQATVQDSSYMSAMIPHHSIAILTSERAQISDVRVRQLADAIIEAQRREIKEMDWLIRDIADNGIAASQAEAEGRPVPEFTAEP
jgi:magnesium-transporting ATPase (P-type)